METFILKDGDVVLKGEIFGKHKQTNTSPAVHVVCVNREMSESYNSTLDPQTVELSMCRSV